MPARTGAILAALLLASGPLGAAERFVGPRGTAGGAGTAESPWPLAAVLESKLPVAAGDTVWLLEGEYPISGPDSKEGLVATLSGAPDHPVVVRSRPGRRARLKGQLTVQGSHVWYWGFEIEGGETTVNVFAPHSKLINLDIHGGAQGVGHWQQAHDSEIYGCIIHDFGVDGGDRGHGHAIYIQNESGTKLIAENVLFRGFGMNFHAYTQAGSLKGMRIEGNVSFAAGTRKPGQVYDAYLISGYTPADGIELVGNVGYHAGGKAELGGGWRPIARVESYKHLLNGTCVVKDNYLAGARGLLVGKWTRATVTGNTLWSDQVLASVRPPEAGRLAGYTWDDNAYIATGDGPRFGIVASSGDTEKATEYVGLDAWRARTGFDGKSRVERVAGAMPAGTRVFTWPNRYEKGRGHAAVFNWDAREELELDLSRILEPGDAFRVHDVQVDVHERPVASGVFRGGSVKVPALRSKESPCFEAYLVLRDER